MVIWSLGVVCLPICGFPENGRCQLFSISGSCRFFSQICWVSPKLPRTILALWLVASLRPFDTCTEYMPCSQRTQPPRNRTPLLGLEPHALHMLGKPSTTELFFKFWDGISINCPCWLRIFHSQPQLKLQTFESPHPALKSLLKLHLTEGLGCLDYSSLLSAGSHFWEQDFPSQVCWWARLHVDSGSKCPVNLEFGL